MNALISNLLKTLLLFCMCFMSVSNIAQITNDLLQYDSDFEASNFKNLEQTSALKLLISIAPDMDEARSEEIHSEIKEIIAKFERKKLDKLHPRNQAKLMQFILHGKKLKYYKSTSPFHRIFIDGQYNCVSSTALYAIVCDHFGIPYAIKEQPTHVYLMIYPNSDRIKIETTAKNGVSLERSLNTEKTVNSLVELGYLDENEVKRKGVERAFNDYFYKDVVISLKDLAGDQYANEALKYLEQKDTLRSISSITKACAIYPSHHNQMIKKNIFESYLYPMRFLNFDEIIVLKEYCNLQVASAGNIHYKFYDFVHEHLIVNEDKKYVDSAYAYLIENISVKRNANIIEEYYNYGLAEYYDGARNRKLALKFLLKTIEVNPENNFAMSMAAKTISKVVYEFDVDDYYDSMTDEEYDSLEDELSEGELRLGILENYLDEYPVLGETSVIKSLYYYLLTETSTEAFDDFNDEAMGLEFMEKALNQKKKIEDPDLINDDITAWMYAAAGAYYYRDNQLQKALEYILEGLKISPDHPRLLNKEKIIRNKLN